MSNQTVQGGLRYLAEQNLTQGVPGRGTFVRSDVDLSSLSHDTDTGAPSPEYVALRDQLEDLAAEIRAIRIRLVEIESRLPKSRSSAKPARKS